MPETPPESGSGREPEPASPETPPPSTWIGEVARMVRDVVDSTPRTIRLCIVIAVAAAAWFLIK